MDNLISIDISKIPFSRYGSLLALFEDEQNELSVRWVAKTFNDDMFRIAFLYNGEIVKPQFSATPVCVKASYKDAEAVLYIQSDSSIVIGSFRL